MIEYFMGEQMKVKLKNMRLCLSLESSDTISPMHRNRRRDGWCNMERSRLRWSVCVRRMESATKIEWERVRERESFNVLLAESVRTVAKSCMSSEDGNETLRWKEIEACAWGNAPFLKLSHTLRFPRATAKGTLPDISCLAPDCGADQSSHRHSP